MLFLLVIVLVPVAGEKIVQYCPDDQVSHFDPGTKLAFCCIPVPLPKGHEFVRCYKNGTKDSTQECPEGLVQEDKTSTESEATCTAEMQCISQENRKISQCDQRGENCIHKCVCNYAGGFCGTAYYDCRVFPQDCDKEHVQENCSCNTPRVNGSGTDTTKMPYTAVTSLNLTYVPKPVNGNNETNTTNGTILTVTDQNDNTSRPVLKEEESGFPVLIVVGAVIAVIVLIVVLAILVRFHESLRTKLLCIYKKCQKCGQNTDYRVVPPTDQLSVVIQHERPIAEVRPYVQPTRDQSFNVYEPHVPNEEPHVPNEEPHVPNEEPHVPNPGDFGIGPSIEDWASLSTIKSTRFDDENTSAKQTDSEQTNDNTIVKQVEDVATPREMEVEENQLHLTPLNCQSGNSGVPIVDPRFQSVSTEWSSFSGGIYSSTSGQFVDNLHEDFNIQEQENL